MTNPPTATAAWYPDPQNAAQLRYWDGMSWTAHTAPLASAPPAISTGSELAPPPAAATSKAPKRSLPVWAWVLIAIAAIIVCVVLSPIFAAVFLVVLITGIVALARDTPTWLKFKNRKVATWITVASAVGFLATGGIASAFTSQPAEREAVAFADVPSPSPTPTKTPTRAPSPTPTPTAIETPVETFSVVDGDTIDTNVGTVRLIGIDAPEQGLWGYSEASTALSTFLATGPVTLVAVDGRDDTDQYGRLLRHVQVGGQDAGAHMLSTGWAITRYDGRDGYGIHPLEAEYVALDAAHAMPAEPAPAPVEPVPAAPAAPAAPVQPAPAPPAEAPPAATDPQFRTCGLANDSGYGNYSADSDAEYSWYQDRDNDGVVCEF